MEENYIKEELIQDKTELEKESELIKNIIKTKDELKNDNRNFEYAENDLIDFYIYQIKANQAKLNYLLKKAKSCGIKIDMIEGLKYEEIG